MSDSAAWQGGTWTPKVPSQDTKAPATPSDKLAGGSWTPKQRPGRSGPLYIGGESKGLLGGLQDKLLDYADKVSAQDYKGKEAQARYYSGGKQGFDSSWFDVLSEPATYARMGADALGVVHSIKEHPYQFVASQIPIARIPVMVNVGYQGAKMLAKGRDKAESAPDYIQRLLLGGSMLSGAVGGVGKDAPADLKTGVSLAKQAPDIIDAASRMWDRKSLVDAAHDTMRDSQVDYDKMLSNSIKQAHERVGDSVQDIASADKVRDPQGYMPSAVVHKVIDTIEAQKNAPPSEFPSLESIRKTLNSYADQFGGRLQWEHLKQIRSKLGGMVEGASGIDAAGANTLYARLTDALASRAQQLGKLDDFQEYAKLTKALDEGSKVYYKLRSAATTPMDFWKALGNEAKRPLLRGTSKNPGLLDTLEKHGGLAPQAIEKALEEHEPLMRLAKQGTSQLAGFGRFSALRRHPAAAIAAAIPSGLASTLLPGGLMMRFLFTAMAMNKAADLVDQFDAARAQPGAAPSLTPFVRGQVVPPQAPPGWQNVPGGGPVLGGGGPTPTQPPPGLSPASPAGLPAQATPTSVAQPQGTPPGQPAPSATPGVTGGTVKPTPVASAPKVSAKAYEAFGVALDPTQWKTPEDAVTAKTRALQQLLVEANAKARAIEQAFKNRLITSAQAIEQINKLAEDAKTAKASIDKVKAPGVGRGARDRLRKGAQVKQATAEVGRQEQATEQTSGASMEDAVGRVAELEKAFKALGEHKRYIEVVRELEKSGSDNYVTWAQELEDAYSEVLKKHSKAPSEQDEIDEFRELIGRAKRTPEQQTRYEELRRLAVEARETNSPLAPAWKRLLNVSLKPGYE